jgi:hypothetical protein
VILLDYRVNLHTQVALLAGIYIGELLRMQHVVVRSQIYEVPLDKISS